MEDLKQRTQKIMDELSVNNITSKWLDTSWPIPDAYTATDVRLIILGQDPTLADPAKTAQVSTVLNLDKPKGRLYHYINSICAGISHNIYATNFLKNFFVRRPTRIKEMNIFDLFKPYWLLLLQDEVNQFPGIPVISLGQPVLRMLVCEGASPNVRDYWGYIPNWKQGERKQFTYLSPDKNVLRRIVFPFPHLPSIRKQFYCERFDEYLGFVRDIGI